MQPDRLAEVKQCIRIFFQFVISYAAEVERIGIGRVFFNGFIDKFNGLAGLALLHKLFAFLEECVGRLGAGVKEKQKK
ncbi:hypothetical protein D3C87_1941980 [compost metagenome]